MAKYSAKGCLFYFGSANPPTTEIIQVDNADLDLGERDPLLDVTDHKTSGGVREKLDNGLKQPAKLSLDLMYDPQDAVHEDLRAKEATPGTSYLKIVLPDAGTAQWVGACRVASFQIGLPKDDKLTAKVSLELMGAFTFTQ